MRKVITKTFFQMLVQIQKDKMLFAACFAPILGSVAIRFGIPWMAGKVEGLKAYYPVFDMMIAMIAPIMFAFIGALVVLEEIDENISNYLAVTPIGKKGYLMARLGYPVLISFVVSCLLIVIFHISDISIATMIWMSFLQATVGLLVSLMIVALATNKVEGMALGKVSSIIMIGSFVSFFKLGKWEYLVAILPTYWIGHYVKEGDAISIFATLFLVTIESLFLWKKYRNKI